MGWGSNLRKRETNGLVGLKTWGRGTNLRKRENKWISRAKICGGLDQPKEKRKQMD